MAGIQDLKAMLKDNPEAANIATQVEQTMQQNIDRISGLEKDIGDWRGKLDEAIIARDKVREVVKNELNITEFTPDAVRAKLSTFASDDAIAAREKQFNELKASSALKLDDLQSKLQERDNKLNQMQLQLAISKTDVMGQTKGEYANEMLMGWIAENAQFDEQGNIVYVGESGETLYNDNADPLTLEDRINQIKSDPARDFVFQSRFLNGGGAPTNKTITGPAGTVDGGKLTRTAMSFEEKKSYRDKYGEEAYNQLPLI